MVKRSSESELIEWVITYAPEANEAPLPLEAELPSEAPPHPAIPSSLRCLPLPRLNERFSRWLWLTLGSIIVVSLAGLGVYTIWNRFRVERALTLVIRAEDEAALAQDSKRLNALADSQDTNWLAVRTRLARQGQAAPMPLPWLRSTPILGRLQTYTYIATDLVRAEVMRQYLAPDGSVVRFNLPQFYRFANGEWKRVPIPEPETFGGKDPSVREGVHTKIYYHLPDAKFVKEELGPYLDQLMARACAQLDCPDDLSLSLDFPDTMRPDLLLTRNDPTRLTNEDPLLFAMIAWDPSEFTGRSIYIPSPQIAGYPADETSQDFYKRSLALRLLFHASHYLSDVDNYHYQAMGSNALASALVVRLGARLGLESSHALEQQPGPTFFPLGSLWFIDQAPSPSFVSTLETRLAARREGLAVMNYLLRDQPPEAEAQLLRGLASTSGYYDAVPWLSVGLGLSPGEVQDEMTALYPEAYRLALDRATRYDLAFSCQAGPMLYSLSTGRANPLFAEPFPYAYLSSWSPDGERLNLYLNGGSAILHLPTEEITWLPGDSQHYPASIFDWPTETIAAYQLWPIPDPQNPGTGPDSSQIKLGFFDLANPRRQFPSVPGVQDYKLSPDKSIAAVVQGFGPEPYTPYSSTISLMPALSGSPAFLAEGIAPAWSPDGRQLAYVQFEPKGMGFSLWVVNPDIIGDSGWLQRRILTSAELELRPPFMWAQLSWSPNSQQLVLAISTQGRGWHGLVNLEGEATHLQGESAGFPGQLFSADGKFLSTVSQSGLPELHVYDTITERKVRSLRDYWNYAWSPTGHTLVIGSNRSYDLLAEPGDARQEPQPLFTMTNECYQVFWNPKP